MSKDPPTDAAGKPFLTDVKTLRDRARKNLETGNVTASYKGLIKNLTITAGIKNLFNTNPPFSAYYDTNSGAGSDWDPRVGDPRGRSFVLSAEYKFF